MKKVGRFVAILEGNDGKYYSAQQWNLGQIPNQVKAEETDMVYDFGTKIIYYEVYNGKKLVFRHPVISENGKYCRFIDGNFVEVTS